MEVGDVILEKATFERRFGWKPTELTLCPWLWARIMEQVGELSKKHSEDEIAQFYRVDEYGVSYLSDLRVGLDSDFPSKFFLVS